MRNSECSYPVRDRSLNVPESYLRGLEAELRHFKEQTAKPESQVADGSGSRTAGRVERLVENSSAEQFVGKLRELYDLQPPSNAYQATSLDDASSTSHRPRDTGLGESYSQNSYAPLHFDELSMMAIRMSPWKEC